MIRLVLRQGTGSEKEVGVEEMQGHLPKQA